MKTNSRGVGIALAVALLAVAGVGAQQALRSGLDMTTFDKSVRPQDDLFGHVTADG